MINSLCEKIDEFNVKLNIPKTLKEFGINEDEFKEKIDKIAELAVGDACTGSNPRTIDPETMKKLFECRYHGTDSRLLKFQKFRKSRFCKFRQFQGICFSFVNFP